MVKSAKDFFDGAGGESLSLVQAVEVYERLSPIKSTLNEEGRLKLSCAINILSPAQKFVVLSKDMRFAGIHSRLFDAVHAPENQEALLGRLGDVGTNKVAMAMAVEDEDGNWFPTAVVYTYWSDQPGLPEQIRPILAEPVHVLGDKAKVIVPYTISSNFPKAGEALIAHAHSYVYSNVPGAVLSTLSPLRAGNKGFANWVVQKGYEEPKDGRELMARVFEYLMPERLNTGGVYRSHDPVQSFHMAGMGAMLAAIRPDNSDSPLDMALAHGVMANSVYPADTHVLEQNRKRFVEDGVLSISPELAALIPEMYQDRVYVEPFSFMQAGQAWAADEPTI